MPATRDRKPTGMAEVSLTLIDPQVYEGGAQVETEFDIRDEMPTDDWDEAEDRAQASAEAEQYIEEMQPGKEEEQPVKSAGDSPVPVENANGIERSTAIDVVDEDANPTNGEFATSQVVLKIRRRKLKPLNMKKGEIIVTRRLFRSGDSEYLLNGKLCRLRDIQDLFLGTGLGPDLMH